MQKIVVNRFKVYRKFRWHSSDYLWSAKNRYLKYYGIHVQDDSNDSYDILAVPCPHLPNHEDFAHRDDGLDIPVNHRGSFDYFGSPVVVDSSLDYAQIDPAVRDILHYPQVKALLPNVSFRETIVQQRTSWGGGYYGHVISSRIFENLSPSPRLEIEPLPLHVARKIKQVNRPPVKPFSDDVFRYIAAKKRPLNHREIDLFFGGRVDYAVSYGQPNFNFPSLHRNRLLQVWPSLPGNKFLLSYSHQNGENGNVVDGLKYPYEYVNALLSSKCVVSPWGWGAWCIRDLEALACGCLVLKPYCGNTLIYPDIYNPKHQFFVWTDLQFEGLSDQLSYCYSNLEEMQDRASRASNFIFEHLYPNDKVYSNWTSDIRDVLETSLNQSFDLPDFIPAYRDNSNYVR